MKLYVANCSRQAHTFNYKLPEKTQQFGVTIRAGEQHMIENQSEVIAHIIKQHEPYGFQACNKVDKKFSGICYSINKVVTLGAIEDGAEQKTENLENLSQEILEATAVSINNTINNEVIKTGETPIDDGVQVEIVGEPVNGDQDNAPSLKKTVKVGK